MRAYFQPTQEQIDKVQAWLYDGLSLTQIGRRLGVTRNVVSGVIWRRPSLREIQRQKFGPVAIARDHKPGKIVTKSLESSAVLTMAKEPEKPVEAHAPAKEGVILNDLGVGQCKYPISWDAEAIGGWRFCGKQTQPDHIYCQKHHRLIRQGGQQQGGKP